MSTRQRFVGKGALAAAIALLAGSHVSAQAAEPGADAMIEEVVVTGSRIPRAGFDTMLPATVLNAQFLQDRGFQNVADALNQIPSFGLPGNSTQGDQGGPSIGQNFVNFFGLGSQRTLTLVNGKRFVSSNAPTVFGNAAPGLQVDLNVIPASMIERVETVAVGGAPIYGADAIAGTVNIILKDDFEGFEVGGNYGAASKNNDLKEKDFNMLWGAKFGGDRGHLAVGYEYNQKDGLIENQRGELKEGWQFRAPADPTSKFRRVLVPNGHANIVSAGGAITPAGEPLIPNFGLGSVGTDANGDPIYLQFGKDGSLVPYGVGQPTGDAVWSQGGEGIFLPDLTSLYTPIDRTLVTAFVNYDLTDHIQMYGEFYYADNNSTELVNQPAYQSALFGQESYALTFDANHPLLTQSAKDTLAGLGLSSFDIQRGSVDLGDGRVGSEVQLHRFVAGLKGDFALADRKVNWDVSWVKGKSDSRTAQADISSDRFFYALDVVNTANGPQCRVVADPTSRPTDSSAPFGTDLRTDSFDACVPLDIFGEGRASQAAIDYIRVNSTSVTQITQEIYTANANSELFDLPAGAFSLAVGFEHRKEQASYNVDGFTEIGLGRSTPINPVAGSYSTDEYYAEFFAPVVSEGMDIPFVDSASVEGSYRSVDNSLSGTDDIWTIGGRFSPIPDIEFRGNKTRSVRAPSITELFLPLSGTNSFAADPCDAKNSTGGPNPAVRQANCMAEGIDPTTFTSNVGNASVNGFTGGNLNLASEVADAYTAGVILRPRWVPDLTMAVDYVNIKIEDAIENFTLTQIMRSCYDSTSYPNTPFCGQFSRGPDGQLPSVNAFTSGYVNGGTRTLKAWTVDLEWLTGLSSWPGMGGFENPGSLQVGLNMFIPREAESTVLGATDDSLGEPDTADYQGQLNLTYSWNNVRVLWQTRYISKATISNQDGPNAREISKIDAAYLFNAGVQYTYNENIHLSLNVDNVFDKVPQRAAVASGWDNVYDDVGRYVRAGVKVSF